MVTNLTEDTMHWTTKLFIKDREYPVVVYLTDQQPNTTKLAEWVISYAKEHGEEIVDFNVEQAN